MGARSLRGPEARASFARGVAEELGLRAGIPVAAAAGITQAAVGTGLAPGSSTPPSAPAASSSPTPEFNPDPSGRLHASATPSQALITMGVTLSAGGSLSWWRETLGGDYDELVEAASEVGPGSKGFLLPYLSGERTPHLDPNARGLSSVSRLVTAWST